MPMIDITYPAGSLSDDARAALVDELTTVLLRAERAPATEFFRNITWAYVHEPHVYVAGQPVSEPRYRVQVTVPQGALSERRKQELVQEATRVVLERTGADSQRVWVVINEVPEGNWGAAGQVVQFEQLRELAAREREAAAAAT